jgi:hypothetical protein
MPLQDVKTHWNSIFLIMQQAKRLCPIFTSFYIEYMSQSMAWILVVGHALNLVLDKVSATSVYSLGIAAS